MGYLGDTQLASRRATRALSSPRSHAWRHALPAGTPKKRASGAWHAVPGGHVWRTHAIATQEATLGFSLKPPKWLRKAQPGKFIAKNIVPIAIGAAALAIPGVAPAAMAALKGGATIAAKGATGAFRLLGKGGGQLFKGATALQKAVTSGFKSTVQQTIADKAATGGSAITKALEQAAQMVLPGAKDTSPAGTPPIVDQPVSTPPPPTVAPGDYIGPPAPAYSSGGGAGASPASSDITSATPTEAGPAGAPSSKAGLWIAGGLAAVMVGAAVLNRKKARA